MREVIKPVIDSLNEINEKDYPKIENMIDVSIQSMMPEKSKVLSRNLKKKIFGQQDFLQIVLTGHLYIERLINEILSKELNGFNQLGNLFNTFYKKVSFIRSESILNESLCDDILLLNNLRNKYAHRLNYDICIFNIFDFSYLQEYRNNVDIRYKKNKKIAYRVFVKLIVVSLESDLCNQKKYLSLIDED